MGRLNYEQNDLHRYLQTDRDRNRDLDMPACFTITWCGLRLKKRRAAFVEDCDMQAQDAQSMVPGEPRTILWALGPRSYTSRTRELTFQQSRRENILAFATIDTLILSFVLTFQSSFTKFPLYTACNPLFWAAGKLEILHITRTQLLFTARLCAHDTR